MMRDDELTFATIALTAVFMFGALVGILYWVRSEPPSGRSPRSLVELYDADGGIAKVKSVYVACRRGFDGGVADLTVEYAEGAHVTAILDSSELKTLCGGWKWE